MEPNTLLTSSEIQDVESSWSTATLLSQKGLFLLKDVAAKLDLTTAGLKAEAFKLGPVSFEKIGIARLSNGSLHLKSKDPWVVRMERFAPYYSEHLVHRARRVKDHWDANELLRQKGNFFLAEVCRKLTFTATQIRYQAKKKAEPMGVWKDEQLGVYLVDMSVFGPWLTRFWREVKGS